MKTINPDDFRAYSVLEISQMLGVGKTKTREMLDSGILPVTKNRSAVFYFSYIHTGLSEEKHRERIAFLGCGQGIATGIYLYYNRPIP